MADVRVSYTEVLAGGDWQPPYKTFNHLAPNHLSRLTSHLLSHFSCNHTAADKQQSLQSSLLHRLFPSSWMTAFSAAWKIPTCSSVPTPRCLDQEVFSDFFFLWFFKDSFAAFHFQVLSSTVNTLLVLLFYYYYYHHIHHLSGVYYVSRTLLNAPHGFLFNAHSYYFPLFYRGGKWSS